MARESGKWKGKRRIGFGGRREVRRALYHAALTAYRFDKDLAAFSQRMRDNGFAEKQILIAVARKILTRLNAALRDGKFNPEAGTT